MSDDGGSRDGGSESNGPRTSDGVRASVRTTVRAVAAHPDHGFLAYAALLTVVVALLAGVASSFTQYFPGGTSLYPLDPATSGPVAVATKGVARAAFWTVAGLYVLVPVAVGGYLAARGDRHPLAPLTSAAVAVLGLPWLGFVVLRLGTTMPDRPALVALVAGPALVAVALGVAAARGRTGADEPIGTPRRPPLAPFLNLGLVAVFLVGTAVGGVAAGPLSGLVAEASLAAPTTAWDFERAPAGDGRAVLTVTHDGGDKVPAEHLYVRGTGFADVPGAEETGPGRWSGGAAGGDVAAGHSTTVGVAADCEMRLVYENGRTVQTIGLYECGDDAGGSGDATIEPSSPRGAGSVSATDPPNRLLAHATLLTPSPYPDAVALVVAGAVVSLVYRLAAGDDARAGVPQPGGDR